MIFEIPCIPPPCPAPSPRAWLARKQLLDQCLALQNFNHEAELAEGWMAKREALLIGEDVGTTLDAVEALIKKHEDFDKSLQAQVGSCRGDI